MRLILFALLLLATLGVICFVTNEPARTDSKIRVELAGGTLEMQGFPAHFCTQQSATKRGTAPYVLVLGDCSKVEALEAVRACGARVIGPLAPNALLVETSVFALGKITADGRFRAAAEWVPDRKVAPQLKALLTTGKDDPLSVRVIALDASDVQDLVAAAEKAGGTRIEGCLNGKTSVALELSRAVVTDFAKRGSVRWLEPFTRPKLLNDYAVTSVAMNVQPVWNRHGLTGTNQLVTTSDSGIDSGDLSTMHADLRNRLAGFRVCETALITCHNYDASGHGTHTAGSIVGDGTLSDGQIRGVAYGAKLWAWFCGGDNETIYTPEDCDDLFRPDGATNACIHSASWGSDVNGAYDDYAREMDEYVWHHPDFLPVIANGNAGSSAQTVSSPASAKNVLAVGATQNARTDGDKGRPNGDPTQIASFSSRGPCTDGRVKPDLCAPGAGVVSTRSFHGTTLYGVYDANTNYLYCSGTSMATPLVAGATALVRQWLVERRGFTNAPPTAALMKAILTGGARGNASPDNDQGWGRVDLGETLYPSNRAVRLVDRIPFAENYVYSCEVALTNAAPFEAQLVWIDYPATAGAASTLVNDLDLVVSNRTTGAVWYGNGIAGGDHTNTLECVRIANATNGDYVVYVRSHDITHASSEGGAAALYLRGAFEDEDEPETPGTLSIDAAVPASTSFALEVGATNRFDVTVSASEELAVTYEWFVGGVSVPDATTNTFTFVPAWTDRGSVVVKVVASAEGVVPVSRSWIVSVWGSVSVDAATGDDATATGETNSPFASIQAALAKSVANDVVRVGPGTYAGVLVAPAAKVRLEAREGPESTLLDGGGTNRCFDARRNTATVLSGFTLTNGFLVATDSYQYGAGAYGGVLTNCVIVDCDIEDYGYGGGAFGATLIDCRIRYCLAGLAGGGLYRCTASYCTLTDNAADWFTDSYGGGAAVSTLTHCTIYGNVAAASAGGVDAYCTCDDSIVWGNELESGEVSNWEQYSEWDEWGRKCVYITTFYHSCTTPTGYLDDGGNTNAAPRWVNAEEGDFRLGVGSPCLGTASDGGNMGAWQGAGVPGHLLTATAVGPGEITPESAYVLEGESATFTATVHHPFFGWMTNGVTVVGATNVFVWTDVQDDGVLTATFGATNFFVDAVNGNDESNGWSWAAAKRTLQTAVNVAASGETVSVHPGVYTGTVIATSAKIDIFSTDGPEVTKIVGKGGTNRCFSAWLSPSTRLVGFTLENGASEENYGGAVFCGTLSNCVVRNSRAAQGGGGVYNATLYNCLIANCTAGTQGGGAYESTLVNCTVRGNRANAMRGYWGGYAVKCYYAGGGVDCQCHCTNTLIWDNVGPSGGEDNGESFVDTYYDYWRQLHTDYYGPTMNWCCARPASRFGTNSFTNDPQFVTNDVLDARVYETSPCIGGGQNGVNVGQYAGAGVPRVLPTLPANPTGEQVAQAVASVGYADTNVVAGIGTNAETYAQFAVWTTNGLTSKAVVLSKRAFDSFTVRDIVAEPMLLQDDAETKFELSAPEPSSDGTCALTVSLRDGEDLVRLSALKEAFVRRARLGTVPNALHAASGDDVQATQSSGDSVTLTIRSPSDDKGFFGFGN